LQFYLDTPAIIHTGYPHYTRSKNRRFPGIGRYTGSKKWYLSGISSFTGSKNCHLSGIGAYAGSEFLIQRTDYQLIDCFNY